MPPSTISMMLPSPASPFASKRSNIVTLNVGGEIFQTTRETLGLAGPSSLLSDPPSFIDRDPFLFSLLLSLLRTNRLPSSHQSQSHIISDLIAEADFYGVDPSLIVNATASDSFDPFSLRRSLLLPLSGRDPPSVVSADPSGAFHVAHGGKITSFDSLLTRKATILTRFPALDSLLSLSPSLVAAGAVDYPGLQILSTSTTAVKKTLNWYPNGSGNGNGSSSSGTVQAIGSSHDTLFASFESTRRNASAIVAFDRSTLNPIGEIGRREVYGAELDSAIPATKLNWVGGGYGLLLASGSHAGPSGLTGNLRLWDVRSGGGRAVWEVTEREDCFADVSVSEGLSAVFKVVARSGEIMMRDLRKLDEGWACVEAPAQSGGEGVVAGGRGCLLEWYGDKVFVSRGGDVEMWSEVVMGSGVRRNEDGVGVGERVMRRNVMGSRKKDLGREKIVGLGFGGGRMLVIRKGVQTVEVWDSSSRI